jgi:hypothetical protein
MLEPFNFAWPIFWAAFWAVLAAGVATIILWALFMFFLRLID